MSTTRFGNNVHSGFFCKCEFVSFWRPSCGVIGCQPRHMMNGSSTKVLHMHACLKTLACLITRIPFHLLKQMNAVREQGAAAGNAKMLGNFYGCLQSADATSDIACPMEARTPMIPCFHTLHIVYTITIHVLCSCCVQRGGMPRFLALHAHTAACI